MRIINLQKQVTELEARVVAMEEMLKAKMGAYEEFLRTWEGGSKMVRNTEEDAQDKIAKKQRIRKLSD